MPAQLFFFFFLRRYNFREVLAFSTSVFHLIWSLMQSFQFVIFILVMLLFTSSSHLFLGLPSDLVSAGDHLYTFLLPVSLFSSSFNLICHVPSFFQWVHRFFLEPSSQIPLVWFLCFLLVLTFHRHMLPLVSLTFYTSVAGILG